VTAALSFNRRINIWLSAQGSMHARLVLECLEPTSSICRFE
jgi:hypothetical protein